MYLKYFKRAIDLVLALPAAVVLFIPCLFVALIIKLDSPGTVIFKQLRYGKDKQPFIAYKFRTMYISAPSDIATNEFVAAHAHITRSGKIFRKTSIDELAQLINVIKGDMSIVGPRPVIMSEVTLIEERDKYDANSLKPGITGFAQVNGRDELDNVIKSRMDGEYINKVSFSADIKCILKTLLVVFFSLGHHEGLQDQTIAINGQNEVIS